MNLKQPSQIIWKSDKCAHVDSEKESIRKLAEIKIKSEVAKKKLKSRYFSVKNDSSSKYRFITSIRFYFKNLYENILFFNSSFSFSISWLLLCVCFFFFFFQFHPLYDRFLWKIVFFILIENNDVIWINDAFI